jgi:hypothetical protein
MLITGAVVDPAGRFNAQDARALADNTDQLTQLEGQFVAVEATAERITVTNDAYGVYQVFYAEQGGSCLVSNNATVLAHILDASEYDALGVSAFIAGSFAMSNRTLLRGVTVMPGGQQWTWSPTRGLERRTYYHYATLAQATKAPLSERQAAGVAQALGDQLQQLSRQSASLRVPITAGRDSRVMVALALQRRLDAEYFSVGDANRDDVKVGASIAERYGLRHTCKPTSMETIIGSWASLAERVVARNDGLVTLEHIGNAVDEEGLQHNPTMLYGAGGEIARGYYQTARTCLMQPSPHYLTSLLHDAAIGHHHALLTPAAYHAVKGYVAQFVTETLGAGFSASDVPDVFFLNEIVRRWAGSQFRQVMHRFRVFSPFCTRPYAETAFQLVPAERMMEALPLALIRHSYPELLQIPFDKPLMPQTRAALRQKLLKQQLKEDAKSLLRQLGVLAPLRKLKRHPAGSDPKLSKANERLYYLEQMRAYCLDQAASPLWDYVSREAFERMMAKDHQLLRVHNLRMLYNVMTVFYYERYLTSLVSTTASVSINLDC